MSDTMDAPITEVKPPTTEELPTTHKKRRRISEKAKNRFADCVIVLCLAMCVYITVATVSEYHRLNTVMSASVVMALFAMWGGELLMVMLRQIFGSDVVAKARGYQIGNSMMGYSDCYTETATDETNLSV